MIVTWYLDIPVIAGRLASIWVRDCSRGRFVPVLRPLNLTDVQAPVMIARPNGV